MRSWRCRNVASWSRRRFLMMSLWYFAVIFSAFLYYTYAKWRPAQLYSALFDKTIVGAPSGALLLSNRDAALAASWQSGELKRILGDTLEPKAEARPTRTAQINGEQLLLVPNPDSPSTTPRTLPIHRTRANAPAGGVDGAGVGGGRGQAAANNASLGVDAENEVEVEEVEVEEEEVRDPVTDTMEITTVGVENATRAPLPPVVEGYQRVHTGEEMRLHCSRCAVVSSSGHLLNRSRGREIDSAQCVLRMNSAPTVGYERDVGTRTTVRVIGHVNMLLVNSSAELQRQIFVSRASRADKIVIPWLHSFHLMKESNQYYRIAKNLSRAFPEVEFYFLTTEKSKMAEELFKSETGLTTREAHTWLTTGWMTLLFAIDVCDKIDIYGLVDESFCLYHLNDSTPYHYYEPAGIKECKYYKKSEERLTGGHLFITEKAVFARWAHKFNISFHNPSWNTTALTVGAANNRSLALETPFMKMFYEAKRNNRTLFNTRKVIRRVVRRIVVKRKVAVVKKPKS